MPPASKTRHKCNCPKSGLAAYGGKAIHVFPRISMIDEGNMHLLDLAKEVKKGIEDTGHANPFIFNTIGISDAISMGTDGMRSSLPSRDIIADSIELVMRGQLYDANISLVLSSRSLSDYSLDVTRIWYSEVITMLTPAWLPDGYGSLQSTLYHGIRRHNCPRTYNSRRLSSGH